MRVHSAITIALIAACVTRSNPDPRDLGAEQMARSGFGSWIVIVCTSSEDRESCPSGTTLSGELIAVGAHNVFVHANRVLWRVRKADVGTAKVYLYAIGSDTEAWRVLGGLSTLTHGVWFLLSLPIWLGVTGSVINDDYDTARATYPEQTWADLAKWARFPQGLPPGIDEPTLVHQDRTLRTESGVGGVDAGVDAGPAVDASP